MKIKKAWKDFVSVVIDELKSNIVYKKIANNLNNLCAVIFIIIYGVLLVVGSMVALFILLGMITIGIIGVYLLIREAMQVEAIKGWVLQFIICLLATGMPILIVIGIIRDFKKLK